MSDRPPAPAGLHLVADPSLVRRDGGRVLVGGSPFRLMRLSDAGARVVGRWLDGSPVRDGAEAALARRLLDAGSMHPAPDATPDRQATVVTPVKNDGAVFIDTTSPELLVKGTVDFPKRDRTTSNKALAIISSGTSEFRQMYRNSRSIAESVRDKSPGCFDSIRSLHTIFNNKHRAAHGQATGWVINPVLNTACACNKFSGHNAPV